MPPLKRLGRRQNEGSYDEVRETGLNPLRRGHPSRRVLRGTFL
jgi:hypothetical protein